MTKLKKANTLELTAANPKQYLSERILKITILTLTILIACLLLFLVGFVIFKSVPVFKEISFWNFIFTANWSPDEGHFGIGMIIAMTLMLLVVAMAIAMPLTLFTTMFISEYLSKKNQRIAINIIKLLAGIPSVVFGLFAREQIGALFRLMGAPTNDNLMVAGFTMAFMAIPTMISLSYNAVRAVPDGYRFGSLGLGISKEKTTFSIVRKSARTKLVSATILGMSRVLGETMAIMMIAGNATGNLNGTGFGAFIFSSIRTLSSTIGLEILENSGKAHESALYAIGMFLFILVFIINIVILLIVNFESYKTKLKTKKYPRLKLKIQSRNVNYQDYQLTKMVNLKTQDKALKKTYSFTFLLLMWISTIFVIGFTFWILGVVIIKGLIALKWIEAFVSISGQDGIFAALLTTILLILATLLFAIPLALAAAIYLTEFSRPNSAFTKCFRFGINLLSSTPSIIFGIFGLSIFIVLLGLPFSILASALTMTIVILPMLISNFEDALTSIPPSYREAGAGLGMSKTKRLFKIVLPYSAEGLITGVILAMARIIGESAPVYLTLGTAIRMPTEGFLSGGATLTTAIYMLASESRPGQGQDTTYLLSLITIMLVFGLNTASGRISAALVGTGQKTKFGFKARMMKTGQWFKQTFRFQNKLGQWFKEFKIKMKHLWKRWKQKYAWKRLKKNFKNWQQRKKEYQKLKEGGEINA